MRWTIYLKPWGLLPLGAAFGWAIQYSLTEHWFKSVKIVDWLTCYFCGGAICCLLLHGLTLRGLPNIGKANWVPMAICVCTGVAAQSAIIAAILRRNATQASLLENAVPLFTFIIGWSVFGSAELNTRTLIGAVLIFAGLAVVGSG